MSLDLCRFHAHFSIYLNFCLESLNSFGCADFFFQDVLFFGSKTCFWVININKKPSKTISAGKTRTQPGTGNLNRYEPEPARNGSSQNRPEPEPARTRTGQKCKRKIYIYENMFEKIITRRGAGAQGSPYGAHGGAHGAHGGRMGPHITIILIILTINMIIFILCMVIIIFS